MSRDAAASQTPMTLGPRDQLGLNRSNSEMRPGMTGGEMGDDVSVSATSFATSVGGQSMSIRELARAERKAMKRARKELENALANLPAPQFEYDFAVAPEAVTDDEEKDGGKMDIEKDAADLEAEEIARLEKKAAKLYEERSSVVKRIDLPRPIGPIVGKMVLDEKELDDDSDGNKMAEALIRQEMFHLLQHDAYQFPYSLPNEATDGKKKKDKKKKKSKSAPVAGPPEKPLGYISEEAFEVAKQMLEAEEELVIQEKRRLATDTIGSIKSEEQMRGFLRMETVKCSLSNENDSNAKSIEMLKAEYASLNDSIVSMRKHTDKMESKLSIKNGGFVKRCNIFKEATQQSLAELQHSKIEESVYLSLMSHEQRGINSRIETLQEEIEHLEQMEAKFQKQYGELMHEKNRHRILIRQRENLTA